jgi:hypothetical protein
MEGFVIFDDQMSLLLFLSLFPRGLFISARTQCEKSLSPSQIELLLVGWNSCMYQELSVLKDKIDKCDSSRGRGVGGDQIDLRKTPLFSSS